MEEKGSQGENFDTNVDQVASVVLDESDKLTFFERPRAPITAKFRQFPTGSVTPSGWIHQMMESDLIEGMVGALDELYPGIRSDDLYHTARRGGLEDVPEMGDLVLTGAAWEKSIMWWNAETIGNWWDGFIRHAFLTGDPGAMRQANKIIDGLLASQDEDGYIGIYKTKLRYQHTGSNGELWAQTTAFRTMLAYYELTNRGEVLQAVERAMAVTMAHYGEDGLNPFDLKNAFGGVTHGLMMTDVCETLHRITGNSTYLDYATYLYRAFSTFSINRAFNDLRYTFLMVRDEPLEGHAVHTYEHIRSLASAYYQTGYPELSEAYQNLLEKLEPCMLPSGAGHGNEWIAKMEADPNLTGTEYCAMLELRNSFSSLLQKTGEVQFADAAEKLTYNALMGSRSANGKALVYGKHDNCGILDGHHHEHDEKRPDPRYKYSPTHSEPAVCCPPNYARNLPYFLDGMWMQAQDGIAAVMYGPSVLSTRINGAHLKIEQVTAYPKSDQVTLSINVDQPVRFALYLRQPTWSNGLATSLSCDRVEEGYCILDRQWNDGDTLTVTFDHPTLLREFRNGEHFLQRGPLIFAYEIPHEEKTIKDFGKRGFRDYYCFPKEDKADGLMLTGASRFDGTDADPNQSFYEAKSSLQGEFYDPVSRSAVFLPLIPMGNTVLRKVTFPLKKTQSDEETNRL